MDHTPTRSMLDGSTLRSQTTSRGVMQGPVTFWGKTWLFDLRDDREQRKF
jgi:hypothetical protein